MARRVTSNNSSNNRNPTTNNHKKNMDYDIPVVNAIVVGGTPLAPPATAPPPRRGLSKGRSSNVGLKHGQSYKLQTSDISALEQQGFPKGLAQTLSHNTAVFPLRFWVVDNSGSMNIRDGHRIIETNNKDKVKIVDCTRWAEIQQTVEYHAQMASLLQAPTVFRLLNDPGKIIGPMQFSIAENSVQDIDQELAIAIQTMKNTAPGGVTPLSTHIREIRENIMALEPTLRADGTKVSIILATDGLPTDGQGRCDFSTKREFTEALRSLEGLPVWVVVRLCTDEEDVVEFYNDLDNNLELSLEVLDDFMEEAKEVNGGNNWLNYALPLHRCREMGYHSRLFDLLDERQLTPEELRQFLFLLFGPEKFDGVPDPQADWKGFMKSITRVVAKEKKQWNPLTKRVEPWINLKKMNKAYGEKGCSMM